MPPRPADFLPDSGYTGPLSAHPAFDVPLRGDTVVIACHFNPCGYRRPVENLRRFLNWTAALAVPVYMAELTFTCGARPVLPEFHARMAHALTDPQNCLFQKEALLNLAESIVPECVANIIWLDADVLLTNNNFLADTAAALQSCKVIQSFTRCRWLDSAGIERKIKPSFGAACAAGDARCCDWRRYHPGLGGAARREFWRIHGGLWPYAVTGNGDGVWALAAAGQFTRAHKSLAYYSEDAFAAASQWAASMFRWSGGRVGAVKGDAVHLFHGTHANRAYAGKLKMLSTINRRHVTLASNGILEWTPAALAEIPDTIRALADNFAARREDDSAT